MDNSIAYAVDVLDGLKGNILFRDVLTAPTDNVLVLHGLINEKVKQMASAMHILPHPEEVLIAASADILIMACRLSILHSESLGETKDEIDK